MERFSLLPYSFARRHGVVIADADDNFITAFYREEATYHALLEVNRLLDDSARFECVDDSRFTEILNQQYHANAGKSHEVADSVHEQVDLPSLVDRLPEPEDLLEMADEAPVIRLINALLAEAVRGRASDIHIEPGETQLSVRFRVDGMLREIVSLDAAIAPLLASRVKIMSRLDIAEKRVPQDGRITLRIGGHPVDIRVSTLPGNLGERIVMRILDKQNALIELDHMGMTAQQYRDMLSLISRPHGIILATGPTGSGKTTTLYAMLNQLDRGSVNVITIEDPVEYQLPGISQTQVNPRVDLTFARGLRAILRQDPDVIMVGEIRDSETAEIAVQASLTGHLVISTLHTNTAIGAITRLRDMGIEPFLLSSSLAGVIAQRLVRRLCEHCRQKTIISAADLQSLGYEAAAASQVEVCRPVGCQACGESGYSGRAAIFEVVPIDGNLRQLIHDDVPEHALQAHLRQQIPGLARHALRLVLQGITSVEEACRVIRD